MSEFKKCHGAKHSGLVPNQPWGTRKEKVPRMIPTVLAFATGQI